MRGFGGEGLGPTGEGEHGEGKVFDDEAGIGSEDFDEAFSDGLCPGGASPEAGIWGDEDRFGGRIAKGVAYEFEIGAETGVGDSDGDDLEFGEFVGGEEVGRLFDEDMVAGFELRFCQPGKGGASRADEDVFFLSFDAVVCGPAGDGTAEARITGLLVKAEQERVVFDGAVNIGEEAAPVEEPEVGGEGGHGVDAGAGGGLFEVDHWPDGKELLEIFGGLFALFDGGDVGSAAVAKFDHLVVGEELIGSVDGEVGDVESGAEFADRREFSSGS